MLRLVWGLGCWVCFCWFDCLLCFVWVLLVGWLVGLFGFVWFGVDLLFSLLLCLILFITIVLSWLFGFW